MAQPEYRAKAKAVQLTLYYQCEGEPQDDGGHDDVGRLGERDDQDHGEKYPS